MSTSTMGTSMEKITKAQQTHENDGGRNNRDKISEAVKGKKKKGTSTDIPDETKRANSAGVKGLHIETIKITKKFNSENDDNNKENISWVDCSKYESVSGDDEG